VISESDLRLEGRAGAWVLSGPAAPRFTLEVEQLADAQPAAALQPQRGGGQFQLVAQLDHLISEARTG
jgi:hypothetical protein